MIKLTYRLTLAIQVAKHSLPESKDLREFASSRSGEPFSFTLGNGAVAKGLELGIPTMRKGELAQFTMTWQFGRHDMFADLSEAESVIYEVELLGF